MITSHKGKKHPEDRVYKVNGHIMTYWEIAEICVQVCKNEDNIYPKVKGYRGGDMFKDFLIDCMEKRDVTPELLRRNQLC